MNALIDVTGIRIETPRLILRPWRDGDLEDCYAYSRIPGVGEMAGWTHHKSLEDSARVIQMFIRHKKVLALELKENRRVIGSLGIEELDSDSIGMEKLGRELGYVLSKEYWGRGLMPEAVQAVIDYCFQVLNYDFLTCGHFSHNKRSRRVIEKCGFVFYGESTVKTDYDTIETNWNYILYNPDKE